MLWLCYIVPLLWLKWVKMDHKYSTEKGVQILICILKKYGIRKVIACPGTTNFTFVASLENDGDFEIYSCMDERDAVYMACGMAVESGEPIVVSCTMATASKEFYPGLTEAYHRKIPIIAVTSCQMEENEDNLSPQYVDRYPLPKDLVRYSVHIRRVHDEIDEHNVELKINRALHEMRRDGGGPVHINLTTLYDMNFSANTLPNYKNIERYTEDDEFPCIDRVKYSRIAISCGAKWDWTPALVEYIDSFCERYGAVILTDHTSGYSGKYSVLPTLLACQEKYFGDLLYPDLLIHIGEYSGDYYTYYRLMNAGEVWRISEDGVARDTFHHLTKVFDMKEEYFFKKMISICEYEEDVKNQDLYYETLTEDIARIYERFPDVPFSNIYVARSIISKLPHNCVLHLGLSNTLRSWTFFNMPYEDIRTYANVGCRGIDGVLSTLVGASLVNPNILYFGVLGDLTFFYDMNVLGNKHINSNLRLILVNNDGGTEFYIDQSICWKTMENDVGNYVAASGHNGGKSKELVRDYVVNLGFEYLSATNEDELNSIISYFTSSLFTEKPMLLEVFTEHDKERKALYEVRNIINNYDENLWVNSVGGWEHLKSSFECVTEIIKKANGREIYIFGAGKGGRMLLKVLERSGVKVCGFYDNNAQSLDAYKDYPIKEPLNALGKAKSQYIVIGLMRNNRAIMETIKRQLMDMGYGDEDIFVIR